MIVGRNGYIDERLGRIPQDFSVGTKRLPDAPHEFHHRSPGPGKVEDFFLKGPGQDCR